MMELVATVGKWLILLAIPVATFFGVAFLTFWRPEPDEPIEYLAREDAVLVQMTEVSGLPHPQLIDRLTLPAFTLYGDGTVIYADASGEGLVRAEVPGEAVQDLLEEFDDNGFFDFQYEQPLPDGANADATRTYIYAQTKAAANLSTAAHLTLAAERALDSEFEAMAQLRDLLASFDPQAVAGRAIGPYEPAEIALMVERIDADEASTAIEWRDMSVSLASLTPAEGSAVAGRYIPVEEAAQIVQALPNGYAEFREGNAHYRVAYRPALPFEEHFPEFDTGAN
jgi:hypothetical protein